MRKRLLVVGAVVLALVLGVGTASFFALRGSSGSASAHPDAYGVTSDNVAAVRKLIAHGALVLDVRSPTAFDAGKLAGSINIPLAQIAARHGELSKNRTIVAVCHIGSLSYKAAYELDHMGYHAVNLAGGLKAWVAAGYPVVTSSGAPGQVLQ
ncbi:MAG: rhodanese-like domain-containing protein [Acidimicrobiales bacterium]